MYLQEHFVKNYNGNFVSNIKVEGKVKAFFYTEGRKLLLLKISLVQEPFVIS
jgi:hypothetical protein